MCSTSGVREGAMSIVYASTLHYCHQCTSSSTTKVYIAAQYGSGGEVLKSARGLHINNTSHAHDRSNWWARARAKTPYAHVRT